MSYAPSSGNSSVQSLQRSDSQSSQSRRASDEPSHHQQAEDKESNADFPRSTPNTRIQQVCTQTCTSITNPHEVITPIHPTHPHHHQPPEKTTLKSTLRDDWWLWEFLSILFSILSLTTIIAVLRAHEGKALPAWPLGITLNALIAVLSSVVKASLLVPVAACISQLKWLWFRDPRSLRDFDAFDDASRGPWGSLLLLGRVRHVVALGALITVLSVAVEPFVQQIVAYPLRGESAGAGGLAVRAQVYDEGVDVHQFGGGVASGPSFGTKAAVYRGLFTSNVADLSPSCPTGNCSFPAFNSLAFCSKCANVTDMTTRDLKQGKGLGWDGLKGYFWNVNLTYHFPGGASVNLTAYYQDKTLSDLSFGPALVSTTRVPNGMSADALGIRNPMLSLAVLQFPQVDADGYQGNYLQETPLAWQCALYFCVNTYNVTIENGQTNSTVVSTWHDEDTPAVSPPGNKDTILQRPDDFPDALPQYNNLTFTIPANTFNTIMWYLNKTLVGTALTRTAEVSSDDSAVNDVLEAMKVSTDIGKLIGNLATSLSNRMREMYSEPHVDPSTGVKNATYPDAAVAGDSLAVVSYVKVRWEWLSMPALMVGAALVFLLITVTATAKTRYPVWKSSSLAVLYHGLEGKGEGGVVGGQTGETSIDRLSEMRDAADSSLVSIGMGVGANETAQLKLRHWTLEKIPPNSSL